MIHIHGTPFSGPKACARTFFKDRYALIPFKRPEDMQLAKDVCKGFVIDNSAFSYWTSGGELDYDRYVAFVEKHQHPKLLWSVIPDIIGGSEEDNDKYLNRWPPHLNGIPVYHMHHPVDRLVRMARTYPTIGIGAYTSGRPNSKLWWARINVIMEAICVNGIPLCNLHGFRLMNPAIFTRIPLVSADSTSVVRNSNQVKRFGMYVPLTAAKRSNTIAEIIENSDSPLVWRKENPGTV